MSNQIKYIRSKGQLIGLIIPYGYHKTEGIEFFTEKENSLQIGYMARPDGYQVAPHKHNEHSRHITTATQEVLFIRAGIIEVRFFGEEGTCVSQETLAAGDVVMFLAGGHSIRVISQAQIIEVKQGPYLDSLDKTYLDNR